ncbi:hypothetical protein ACQB60_19870 [Actinomycetota bacterium Odt1-20B]
MGRGKGRSNGAFTVGSYEPLSGGGEPPSDAHDAGVGTFLQDVADMTFKGGPRGMELSALDVAARTFTFRHAGEPDPRALVTVEGGGGVEGVEVPTEDRERGGIVWTPRPEAPGWAHLSFLLQELPFVATFREYGPEGGPVVLGVEAPGRAHADVLVEHRGEVWRVRVQLEGRSEPLEFPGMVIGELFGEGRHRALVRDGVVDAGI